MTGQLLDPAAIMKVHYRADYTSGMVCLACGYPTPWPCETYRLAADLAAEREKVQRLEALDVEQVAALVHDRGTVNAVLPVIRAALIGEGAADQPGYSERSWAEWDAQYETVLSRRLFPEHCDHSRRARHDSHVCFDCRAFVGAADQPQTRGRSMKALTKADFEFQYDAEHRFSFFEDELARIYAYGHVAPKEMAERIAVHDRLCGEDDGMTNDELAPYVQHCWAVVIGEPKDGAPLFRFDANKSDADAFPVTVVIR